MFTSKHFINVISLFFISLTVSIYLFKIFFDFTNYPLPITFLTLIAVFGLIAVLGNLLTKRKDTERPVDISDTSVTIIVMLSLLSVVILYFFQQYLDFYLAAKFFMIPVIMASLIIFADRSLNNAEINFIFFVFAFLNGILIFFSIIFLIPLMVFIVYFFKNSILRLIIFTATTLFLAVFLILLYKSFSLNNYLVQEPTVLNLFLFSHSAWFIFTLILISLIAGYLAADLQEVLFASGILLMFPALLGLIDKITTFGFYYSLAIISTENFFLIFPLPFFILSIKYYKVDRFLGKVIS